MSLYGHKYMHNYVEIVNKRLQRVNLSRVIGISHNKRDESALYNEHFYSVERPVEAKYVCMLHQLKIATSACIAFMHV